MSNCIHCGVGFGTHACDPKDVMIKSQEKIIDQLIDILQDKQREITLLKNTPRIYEPAPYWLNPDFKMPVSCDSRGYQPIANVNNSANVPPKRV